MPDTWTYDLATDAGQVRLLITDVDVAGQGGPNAVFTDAEIDAFLTLNGGAVRLAAAQALETIAADEALCSKVIRDHDVSTDGAKVAAELRAQAANLRQQHDETLEADGHFEIIDFRSGWIC